MRYKATDNRRLGIRAAMIAVLVASLPTVGAGPVGAVESIGTIEAAAHSYVQSLLPPQ